MNGTSEPSLHDLPEGRRPPWARFRARLEALGFRPSKTLGQNFLVDPNTVRSIARDAGVGAGARVLEVGAGCGFLSVELALLGVELVAVEIDTRLFQVASDFLAAHGNARLVRADVLEDKHTLSPAVAGELPERGPWHLVSNLPYSISAPLLVVLARLPNPPLSMTVLVQDEVARRIAASPGGSEWGALTARLAVLYRVRLGRPVGAQLFWPRPRVASRVVHLALEPVPGLGPAPHAARLAAYDRLTESLFQSRRKQLGGLLRRVVGESAAREVLSRRGLDPLARPETLDPEALLGLVRALEGPGGRAWGPLTDPQGGADED